MLDASPPRDEASPEGPRAPAPAPTGARLREARLRRGLTIAESATDTRINPTYLEAMEAERWELLPAPVYARGFLRSYARYLRFAPDEIEAMVPRSLPRPRDLEPAPGLRRSAAQPALSLPSFKWLRGTGDPKLPSRSDVRPPAPLGATRPPVSRPTASAGVARPPLARPTRSTAGPASNASAGTSAVVERIQASTAAVLLEVQRAAARGAALAIANPTMLGASVVAAFVLLVGGYVWYAPSTTSSPSSGGNASGAPTRSTAAALPTVSRQLAGPEPTGAPGLTPGAPTPAAAPREGGMPDLTGMTRRDAEDELNRRGLAFVVIEVATPAAEPGSVYNQSPQPGKDVKRGDSITLLVARAP